MTAWSYLVDWGRTGSYTDETAYVRSIIIRRGRSSQLSGSNFSYVNTGTCQATMNDNARRFDLFNSASPIYSSLLPYRPVQVLFGATAIYTGDTSRIVPQRKNRQSQIEAVDGIDYLTRAKCGDAASPADTAYKISDAVSRILTLSSWPGGSSVEDNGDTVAYWWADPNKSPWSQIIELSDSVAGVPFVGADGAFNFVARNYGGAADVTLTDDDVSNDIEADIPRADVRNDISITASPWQLSNTGEVIWLVPSGWALGLEVGESKTVYLDYELTTGVQGYCWNFITPVVHTDYNASRYIDGSGTDYADDIGVVATPYQTRAKVVFTNNNATYKLYVYNFRLRGQLIIPNVPSTSSSVDSDSITAYGSSSFSINSPFVQNPVWAQDYAEYIKALLINPRKIVTVKFTGMSGAQFDYDLFDIVNLNLSSLGVTGSYYITYIEHDLKPQKWITTWRLEPTPVDTAAFWIFTAQLGVNTALGW
jgi:hypothetical protein